MTSSTLDEAPSRPDVLLYKVTDAARLLNLSRTVVFELLRTGRLRSVKQGRVRLIPAAALGVEACTHLCMTHVIPALGHRKLRDLSAEDVDRWLAAKPKMLSTRTLQGLHSCLNRTVKRAMARDKVKRNVVALCSVPVGQPGRPSKALTLAQAEAVLAATDGSRMHAYIVVALLAGARTEELRALRWVDVDLAGRPARWPLQHRRHRARLPQADPPDIADGCNDDGPRLRDTDGKQ